MKSVRHYARDERGKISMKKRVIVWLLLLLFLFTLVGCSTSKTSKEASPQINLKAAVLRGPTAVGMIKMMDSKPSLGANVTVDYVVEQTPDTLNAKLLTGEIAFATIPTNSAAVLYNKGVNYQLAAMNTWGVMYVLANGVDLNSWADLKGKEVENAAQGSAADVVFRYLLKQNEIDPTKDITIKYIASPVEQAQLAIAGKSKITVLPEPWVSTVLAKNKDMKLSLDLQKEWTRINGGDTPFAQTCLVVNKDFAKAHPDIVDKFLQEYSNSIDWVNKNPVDAGNLIKNHDIGIPADIAAAAIPRCNLRYQSSTDAQAAVTKYLQILFDFAPASIGGKLPDANFFYKK